MRECKQIKQINGLFCVIFKGVTYGRFERYADAEYYMKSLRVWS